MNIDEVKARVHARGQDEINKCIEEFHASVVKFRQDYSRMLLGEPRPAAVANQQSDPNAPSPPPDAAHNVSSR
jgi:hypothetical protein